MEKQQGVEVKHPSDLALKRMNQHAAEIKESIMSFDADEEENFLAAPSAGLRLEDARAGLFVPGGAGSGGGCGGVDSAAAKAKAKAKPAAKAKVEKPGLAASKLRQQTTRAWHALQGEMPAAVKTGNAMLHDCLAEYGGSEEMAKSQDLAYRTVQFRLSCLMKLMSQEKVKPTAAEGQALLDMFQSGDAFFQEQGWAAENVQTMGQMLHVRFTLLELQRTAELVREMGTCHEEAIAIARAVAKAVITEANTWRSNIAALKKARELEAKQLKKEIERDAKRLKKQKEQEESRRKKEEAARAKRENKEKRTAEAGHSQCL